MKLLFIPVITSIFFSACAVKESDTSTQKVIKHTANSPMYALVATGYLLETALVTTLGYSAKAIGETKNALTPKEQEEKKIPPSKYTRPVSKNGVWIISNGVVTAEEATTK